MRARERRHPLPKFLLAGLKKGHVRSSLLLRGKELVHVFLQCIQVSNNAAELLLDWVALA